MPVAVGRLVAHVLGYLRPLHIPTHARGHDTVPADGLSHNFFDGFAPQPALDGRPPQVGFRRPQQTEHMKRDCLANGTNFCFGDSSNYCSFCGTCCSSPSNGNNKWCCPSGGICCGNSCCGSGQSCNNGQCYLPVVTITSTSSVVVTHTHFASSLATVIQRVVESSVVKSIVDVTNTDAETQTNWVYVTTTSIGKRAEPTGLPLEDINRRRPGAISEIASATRIDAKITSLPLRIQSPSPAPIPSIEPSATSEAIASENILPRDAQADANTMAASRSTSTVIVSAIITNVVTSFIASTTTVLTTSTNVETIYQTNTVVLNAKATVEATSTWTYTSHHPVTVTMTEFSTNSEPASQSTEAPALVTSDSDGSSTNKNLSGASIAGIAIGVTAFTAIFVAGLIFFVRRHLARAKERRSISEDYAFLGTGRSDFDGPTRSNSNSGKGPSIVMLNRHYSGPPPPSARRPSAQITPTQYADPMQNERGLPPIPWYSTTSKTSPPTSPISPTSGSFPFSGDLKQLVSQTSPASPTYARTSHMRSGSANTTITAGSSTIAGGNSTQTSVRSNSSKTVRFSDSGFSHQRASSSGSGAGTVIDSSSDVPMETSGNIPTVQVTPISPVTQVAPSELPSVPAPCAYLSPDPPSPLLQPHLGPLRIVNGSIDEASDQDERTPKTPPPAQ